MTGRMTCGGIEGRIQAILYAHRWVLVVARQSFC